MMVRRSLMYVALSSVAVLALVRSGHAQQCDDFNACTQNDMCVDGECTGTPASGGSCEDYNDCTINARCVDDGFGASCIGDPAPAGTECQGGCGTCQALSPIPIPGLPLFCVPKSGTAGQECTPSFVENLGQCYVGRCQEFGGGGGIPGIAICSAQPKQCPDTGGSLCTADACNPENGRCERVEKGCGYPECTRCDPATGQCITRNEGGACNDFNECTAQSKCEAGNCVAGAPINGGPTVTPTTTPPTSVSTATPTLPAANPTTPAGPTCTCDCNSDGMVAINETILAVNIGLGTFGTDSCLAADPNRDGMVAINEVIQGVNYGLSTCPS